MENGHLCDCGHSESEHKMKYTKNFTFSITTCKECSGDGYAIEQKIAITP